tara:strand:- start:315 stop:869 length:555 start_codon:yes stop_codon:yes gene_type:complete
MANPMYGQNKTDDALDSAYALHKGAPIHSVVKTDSGSITVTAAANTDSTFTQPANTFLKDLILVPKSAITVGDNGSDELDFGLGTSAGGGQLLANKALLDGADVSAAANVPFYMIENGMGKAANGHICSGVATSEASAVAASLYSSAERTLHVRFTPINQNLAATGSITIIAVFVDCSATKIHG